MWHPICGGRLDLHGDGVVFIGSPATESIAFTEIVAFGRSTAVEMTAEPCRTPPNWLCIGLMDNLWRSSAAILLRTWSRPPTKSGVFAIAPSRINPHDPGPMKWLTRSEK